MIIGFSVMHHLIMFGFSWKLTNVDVFQGMFEPHLKSFYVRSSDALHIKLLKVQ